MNVDLSKNCSNILTDQNKTAVFLRQWQTDNLTQTSLSRCVCNTVYGPGNPDLSGAGVTLSLYVQGILYLLVGPIPVLLSFFKSLYRQRAPGKIIRRFDSLFNTLCVTGCVFHLTSFLSSCVRFAQRPPAFEVGQIQLVFQYETLLYWLAALVIYLRPYPVEQMPDFPWFGRGHWSLLIPVYAISLSGAILDEMIARALPSDSIEAQVTKVCTNSGHYPIVQIREHNAFWVVISAINLTFILLLRP